ncbi:hypothetical protein D3C76_1154840 [compost metagenome]
MPKNNVVSLTARRTPKKIADSTTGFSFSAEVEKDLDKLMSKLGLSRDEAMKVATDFYKSYPMLMELVRTPNHLLGGK